ncbi:hypothetical protein Sango_2091400 [Sesamum angolense]|uniref:Copia protein n=1 Tax=Sesamum angolense TaxID=2727404 RepID=A0AAE1WBH9_9LAMI|nr:hypothetical protein Sango_2091400 [Sesamum angolense]
MVMQAKGSNFRSLGNATGFQKKKIAAEKVAQFLALWQGWTPKRNVLRFTGYPDWYMGDIESALKLRTAMNSLKAMMYHQDKSEDSKDLFMDSSKHHDNEISVLIARSSEEEIKGVKCHLDRLFTIKDLGTAKYFLAWKLQDQTKALSVLKLKGSLSLTAYRDADWAACVDSRRSLTIYYIFLSSALISWKIKKQNTFPCSTAEAEYRSMGTTACELTWIFNLVQDLQVHIPTPIPFLCDHQAALHIIANSVFHEHTKHLEIDCHLVRDKYKTGFLAPSHVSSKAQLADVFTKLLTGPTFLSLIFKLGLVNLFPNST